MRIREVEELVGISKKNIRFYEDAGLLKPGRSAENSYRDYTDEDIRTLRRIKLLRKLNMPLGEIRALLEGKSGMQESCLRHSAALDGQISDLGKARWLTERLACECASLSELDEELWLREMEKMEGEGVSFMNIQSHDVRKKYTSAAIACVCMILVFAALIVLLVWAQNVDPMPLGLFIAVIAIPAGCIICTAAAFVSRYREIKGGEENDLGNY